MTTHTERFLTVERRKSMAAQWCWRLATFAVPYLLIVVVGHRFGAIETQSAFWLLAFGIAVILASLITGARGFYELWSFGHEGGLKAARGVVLSVILLLPFVYYGAKAFILPPLYDISTDLEDPPAFESAIEDRIDGMNAIVDPTQQLAEIQLRFYPRVSARRYPLGTGKVFTEVVALFGEREWTILTSETEQGAAPIDLEGSGLVAKPTLDDEGKPLRLPMPTSRADYSDQPERLEGVESVLVSPVGRGDDDDGGDENQERYVEAVAKSFLLGFESDVVIRLVEEENGTLVDMRSNSRWGPHDLGSNAQRIEEFMKDLDAALQGLSG